MTLTYLFIIGRGRITIIGMCRSSFGLPFALGLLGLIIFIHRHVRTYALVSHLHVLFGWHIL